MATVTFLAAVGGDNSTVDDTDSPTTGLKAGGHRTRFVAALAQLVAVAGFVVTKATEAAASAVSAAASAATAAGAASAAAGFIATSTTSREIGTGSKAFVIQTGKAYTPGAPVAVINTADPSKAMYGSVTSYDALTGDLVVEVAHVTGSGTLASWNVTISGPRGGTGATGAAAVTSFTDTSSTTVALVAGQRYRLTARITAGTLPASPGVGADYIEIMTAIDASTNYHTFTPNGAETVSVNGVAGSPFEFDGPIGQIIRLVPIAGGWELGA